MLIGAFYIRFEALENSKILAIASGISYQFFLMQLFLWPLSTKVLEIFKLERNEGKILISLGLCVVISYLVWKFYDVPVRQLLKK